MKWSLHNANLRIGQSLVELLLVIAIASLVLPSITTVFVTSRAGRSQSNLRQQAVAYAKEALEAVRVVRENDWDTFAVNGTYYPQISATTWVLTPGTQTVNGLTRSVVLSDVYRDQSGAIAQSGTLDPSTKKVVITVSWNQPIAQQIQTTAYLTRYLENITYTETTESDFDAGTINGATVTNDAGGEVILGAGGQGQWCAPNLSITSLDLPKNGAANAVTAIEGRAFVGTGDNSSGVSFANISITNANPPSASVIGTYDCCKTNDIFGEANYSYIATDTNSKEVVIVDLTTNPYSEAGYVNTPGNSDATGIFVLGNTGYVTAGNKLYNFDLSSKSGSRPLLDSDGVHVALFGTAGELFVVGNYAYVTLGTWAARELAIIDISNPSNMQYVGYADVNGESGQEVFVNSTGTRAYLATSSSSTKSEFFIIDTSSKSGSRPVISSYDANGMDPKGVTVVTGNKAVLVGSGAEEYQVIDITNENSLSRCGGLNIDSGIREVSSVLEADGDAYSYIVTGDSSAEFKIIEGGPGGQYSTEGTFESQTFDPQVETRYYNRFTATISKPSQTDISLQLAVADEAVDHTCNGVTYNFVGPDGTASTFFTSTDNQTISGQIPSDDNGSGYENPARCLRYKSYLSTDDSTQTPVLYDITINYSP